MTNLFSLACGNRLYKFNILLIFALFGVVFQICAQDKLVISKKIDEIIGRISKYSDCGIIVYNPLSNDTIYEKNPLKSLIPASNAKLFITAAALNMLGGDFKLSTKLFIDKNAIVEGELNGNVYIRGMGNALFSVDDVNVFAEEIYRLGIKKINGDIIADESFFDSLYKRDDWILEEAGGADMPNISGLTINKNRINFSFKAGGKAGALLNYEVYPNFDFMKINNRAKTTSKRNRPYIRQNINSGGFDFIIEGGLRRNSGRNVNVNIKDAALFIAMCLYEKITGLGIEIMGVPKKGLTNIESQEICNASVELREIINIINKQSDNFLAENLFKTIGALYGDVAGNSFHATQAVISFLDELDIDKRETVLVDGSGLSRYNSITAGALNGLLHGVYFDENIFEDFFNSLSIAGYDGTLSGRMKGSFAENNFRGKTGTLRGVSSLAGYVKGRSGEEYIVVIIIDYRKGSRRTHKSVEDKIAEIIAEFG